MRYLIKFSSIITLTLCSNILLLTGNYLNTDEHVPNMQIRKRDKNTFLQEELVCLFYLALYWMSLKEKTLCSAT